MTETYGVVSLRLAQLDLAEFGLVLGGYHDFDRVNLHLTRAEAAGIDTTHERAQLEREREFYRKSSCSGL